jgi:hypothetical protein
VFHEKKGLQGDCEIVWKRHPAAMPCFRDMLASRKCSILSGPGCDEEWLPLGPGHNCQACQDIAIDS